jgi:O-antigen ligase
LLCAPLAFGSVDPWAWGAAIILTVIPLLLWSAGSVRQGQVLLARSPLYLPAIAFLALVIAQLAARSSRDAASTNEALLKFTWLLLIFFLTQELYSFAPDKAWGTLGAAVLIYASLLGLFAALQFFSAPGMIYWVVPSPNVSFGPYVNRDHFAGLFEMLTPIAAAYYIARARKSPLALLWAAGLLFAVASLLLTGSRGGFLALLAEVAILLTVIYLRTGERRRSAIFIGAAALLLVTVGFLEFVTPDRLPSRLATLARFNEASVNGKRPTVARDTLRIFAAHPIIGSGLGTFEAVYPQYQSFVSEDTWPEAHNDYVQILAESGLLGGILVLVALGLFVYQAFWIKGRSQLADVAEWLQVGAAVGCCGLLVHSLVDFNLHIPANAAWFAACAALATIGPGRGSKTATARRLQR